MANKGDIYKVALPNGDEYNFKDKYVRENYRALNNNDFDTINVTELNSGNIINTGAARFLNTINGSVSGTSSNVTGTVAIANGGTGATTRLGAAQNLTNEAVSNPGYVVGLTSNWGKFGYTTIAQLKTAIGYDTTVTSGSSNLITSGAVAQAIDNLPEPMVFKGTLGTNGTITTLPTASASNEGYTYKVITAGTYASQAAKVGDVFVCAELTSGSYSWVLIPAGDTDSDSWRNIKINGTEKLTTAISSGAVDFVNGTNTTVSFNATGNKIQVDAVDTKYALDISGNNVILKKDGTTQDTITVSYATSAGSANSVAWGNVSGKPTKLSQFTNDITFATSIASSTDTSEITLAHGGVYALTAGGTSFVFKMPSSGNTDTKVRQTLVTDTDNTNRPLLLAYSNTSTTTGNVDNISYRANTIYANASTGTITATKFVGELDGNAATATNASKVNNLTVQTAVPANAVFTDQYVSQSAASANKWRKILLSYQADTTAGTAVTANTNVVYETPNAEINPSTGSIRSAGNITADIFGVSASDGTSGGISLYSGAGNVDNYGIAFRKTADKGKHGYVQSDWATYFTMNSGATTRGWVFKLNQTDGNVASISGAGNAVFNGSLTLGGNATNTSGVRQVYNSTTQSLDFVFVA